MLDTSDKLRLRSGYTIVINQSDRDTLELNAPDGPICVRIHLAPEGAQVEVFSHTLRVHTASTLSLDCEEFAVNARRDVTIRTGGDLMQVAEGAVRMHAEGMLHVEGFSVNMRARLGDVQVAANDDVMLDGERVRLNSPNLTK